MRNQPNSRPIIGADIREKAASIIIPLRMHDLNSNAIQEYGFPFQMVWAFYTVSMRDRGKGLDDAKAIAHLSIQLAATTAYTTPNQGVSLELSPEVEQRIELVTTNLWSYLLERFPTRDMLLLEASYDALRRGIFNRDQAAQFASFMLDRVIYSEAWRKRVNKYADDKNLPRPDRRGRPSKSGT